MESDTLVQLIASTCQLGPARGKLDSQPLTSKNTIYNSHISTIMPDNIPAAVENYAI